MPKVEQKVGDMRGGKGYGRISYEELTALLRDAGHLTRQQYLVKVTLDEDALHFLTKAKAE